MLDDEKRIVPKREARPVPLTTERVHPGELLHEEFLDPMGVTAADFAGHIGVAPHTVVDICSEKAPISMEMALRLERALGTTAQFWLNAQHAYDDSRELKRLRDSGGIQAVESVPALIMD
jgi:addiction module HigA family antidote